MRGQGAAGAKHDTAAIGEGEVGYEVIVEEAIGGDFNDQRGEGRVDVAAVVGV